MRTSLAVLGIAAAACGGSQQAAPPQETETESVKAFDLLVKGPAQMTCPRGMLARRTRAWVSLDGRAIVREEPLEELERVAIQEVRDAHVRVFDEHDDARLLLWVPREDLAPMIVHETALGEGVTAFAGATLRERTDGTDRVRVTVADDGLIASGEVPADAVGDVWIAPPDPAPATGTHHLDADTAIRAAPDGATVATATDLLEVNVVAAAGAWTEIETLGHRVRARGHVPAAAVHPREQMYWGQGIGMGRGVYSPSLHVPGGSCLYDGPDGALVGVTTGGAERTIAGNEPGWTGILVRTWFGDATVYVRDEGSGDTVRIERCAGDLVPDAMPEPDWPDDDAGA